VLREVLFLFLFSIPHHNHKTMKDLPELMSMTTYCGEEVQMAGLEDITEPGGCGEPEYLLHLLNRHGALRLATDTEYFDSLRKDENNV
jgi:hypothetical protein